MTDDTNSVSPKEINARIFEIFSNMSENENRKFLSILISKIPEEKGRELLKKLEGWVKSKDIDFREHPRKYTSVLVEILSDGVIFTEFIQDISNGGVFIQTDGNFYLYQKITMTFSLPKGKKDITVSGKVVRVDSQGISVQFDEVLPDI
jgi:hypothetical protein